MKQLVIERQLDEQVSGELMAPIEVRQGPLGRKILRILRDDIPAASWGAYELTTFVQDEARMVDEALAILATAEGGTAPKADAPVIVPARLIERRTTRRGDA